MKDDNLMLDRTLEDGRFSVELFKTYQVDKPYRVNIYDHAYHAGELVISRGFETLLMAECFFHGSKEGWDV